MANIFRQCQSGRIPSGSFIDKNPIANEFWEVAGGITEATGTSAGAATSAILGAALWLTIVTSAGAAGSSVIGAARFAGVGASAGIGTPTAISGKVLPGYSSAVGIATVTAEGEAVILGSEGIAQGVATTNVVGACLSGAEGTSEGIASAEFLGGANVGVIASADGIAEVLGIGQTLTFLPTDGTSEGIAYAYADSGKIAATVGTCVIGEGEIIERIVLSDGHLAKRISKKFYLKL